MKFAQISIGDAATAPVKLPWPGRDEPVALLVRVLNTEERADAVAKGRAYAVRKGIEEPKDGDEVFALGVKHHTLLACCRDVEAPAEPFFASADEVRKLDPERVAFLYELWEHHQDAHAPQQGTLSADQYVAKVLEMAEATDPGPFVALRPALQWSLLRTLAAQQLSYWTAKSPSSSDSATSITSGSSNPASEADAGPEAMATA